MPRGRGRFSRERHPRGEIRDVRADVGCPKHGIGIVHREGLGSGVGDENAVELDAR